LQALIKGVARNAFNHHIGLTGEVTAGVPGRHMRPPELGQDHLFHLEGDDGGGILPFRNARDLHQQPPGNVRVRRAPERCHAARMDPLADGEAVDDRAACYL